MKHRLVLLRHGAVGRRWRGRLLGRRDVPLSPDGRRQARGAAAVVRRFSPDCCRCSPLLRARQTAARAVAPLGLTVDIDERLGEVDFGAWDGRTFAEVAAAAPAAVDRWAVYDADFGFPGGETLGGFAARVGRLAATVPSVRGTTLLVTHGGVIRMLLCLLLRLAPAQYVLFDIAYAGVTVVDVHAGGGGVLRALNLTHEEG